MFNINPKQMQAAMKQMGIKQQQIDAIRVIIETPEKNIIIQPAEVMKINMQGQESYQITGDSREEEKESSASSYEDIQTIIEKTNCTEQQAKAALTETGDLAEAIIKLS